MPPTPDTHVLAATDEAAHARAAAAGVPDGTWRRVHSIDDLEGATGALLFADDWRDLFPPLTELGVNDGPAAFLQAAHAAPDLLVEVTL